MQSTNPSRRAPPHRRVGLAWLAVCVALAGWFSIGESSRPNSTLHPRRPSAESVALIGATRATGRPEKAILPDAPRALRTKAIEDIRVGERVLGINPLADGPLAAQDEALPDPATWKKVVLCLNGSGYGRLDMTFIQPPEWFAETGARVGGTVELDLPELGAEGEAKVLSIGPCPAIEPGDGAAVTGTFVHRSAGNLVDVRFEGVEESDGVTDNHLYFSLDRDNFVEASHLRRGERIESAIDGDVLRVASVTRRPADQLVYNLQVNGQHVYHVGSRGALVHNACPNPYGRRGSPAHQAMIGQAEKRLVAKGWTTMSGGSRPEELIKSVGRYADLVMEKGGKTIAVQVGRATRSRLPIARERRAIDDLRSSGLFDHVFFLQY